MQRRGSVAPYTREEVALLVETLARNAGNISKAASELGISRQKAYRMLEVADVDRAAVGEGTAPPDALPRNR